jgi:hypothetical protein
MSLNDIRSYFDLSNNRDKRIPLRVVTALLHADWILAHPDWIVNKRQAIIIFKDRLINLKHYPQLTWTYLTLESYQRKLEGKKFQSTINLTAKQEVYINRLKKSVIEPFSALSINLPSSNPNPFIQRNNMGDQTFTDVLTGQTIRTRVAPTVNADSRDYGPATNTNYLRKHLQAEPLYGQLFLKNCATGLFAASLDSGNVAQTVDLISRIRFMIKSGAPNPVGQTVLAIAELHGGLLPDTHYLTREQSTRVVIDCAQWLMVPNNLAATGLIAGANMVEQIGNPPAADANMNIGYAVNYLSFMADVNMQMLSGPINFVASAVVAYCKRGWASEEAVTKIADGVYEDVGKRVRLNTRAINSFYKAYGKYINPDNVGRLFAHWRAVLPADAMRLTITLQQTLGSGLTQMITILRAMTEYPTFPWAQISVILPEEWGRFTAGQALVGDNLYYGFSTDMGIAKSTGYKSISWIAKELLVRIKAENALARYGGWANGPDKSPLIRPMVEQFVLDQGNVVVPVMTAEQHVIYAAQMERIRASYEQMQAAEQPNQ